MKLVFPLLFLLAPLQDPADPSGVIDTLIATIPGYRRAQEAALVEDGEFLRRASLDLVGSPPSLGEVQAFMADERPSKRADLVDQLLASPGFADFWSRRLGEVLLGNFHEAAGGAPFVRWLGERVTEDTPWPEILRKVLEAEGALQEVPAAAWKVALWREKDEGAAFTISLSRQAFGINLFCAECHDHAFDKWRVEDFYQLAAFTRARTVQKTDQGIVVLEAAFDPEKHGKKVDPPGKFRLGLATDPRLFNAPPAEAGRKLSLSLAQAVVQDPHVDRAFVNRVWAWLMGRGIVNPVDEHDLKNKPLSRDLLPALEKGYREKGRSLRALIRAICLSRGYQRRSDAPGELRKIDFSRGVIRPLSAGQLLASLEVATGGKATSTASEGYRITAQVWGRPGSETEMTPLRSESQAINWLREDPAVQQKLKDSAVLRRIARGTEPMAERIGQLFLAVLSRHPTAEESDRFGAFLGAGGAAPWETALWVLLNTTEFRTRH